MTFSRFGFDATVSAGSTTGAGEVLSYPVAHAGISPFHLFSDRLAVGLAFGFDNRGEISRETDGGGTSTIAESVTSVSVLAFGQYALSELAFVSLGAGSAGGGDSGRAVVVTAGVGVVF
jgi:hypothetical protein